MGKKRLALLPVLSACGAFLGGCASAGPPGEIISIGSTKAPFLGPPQEFRKLHYRLSEELFKQPVMFDAQSDGERIGIQLAQGNYHYAFLSATEYCEVGDKGKLTLVASGLNKLGKIQRKAYIVVQAKSHVKEITDIRLKRFAYGFKGDLLTDIATKAALEMAGVSPRDVLPELLPPFSLLGGLYLGHDVAKTIIADPTVNSGVVDEVDYAQMPETGGSFLTGVSKDQFKIVGQTVDVPEILVVAGPGADPARTEQLRAFLLNEAKNDADICKELGVSGFAEPDPAVYMQACELLPAGS